MFQTNPRSLIEATDNESGDTLLHTAVALKQYETVLSLLGSDVRMDVKNAAGLTPLDIAQKHEDKTIFTLLKTRMEWVSQNSTGISLNRALNLIQDSYHAIEKGRDKELVLVLGETGVGKSTLINYFNGVEYREAGTRGFDLHTECVTGTEIASVGHSAMVSETLYPHVLQLQTPTQHLHVADLAGINGTRESVVELAGTLSTHLLSKMTQAIKAILFVVDMNSLNASRGGPFRQTIKTLNKILRGNFTEESSRSVYFAITKLPSGVTVEQVLGRFIHPLYQQLEALVASDGLGEEDKAMYHTVSLMLQHPERIFIPDVFDKGPSREPLLTALSNASCLSKEGLDFLHMDRHQEAFLNLLRFLGKEYISRCDQVNQFIPARITQLEDLIKVDRDHVLHWAGEITEAEKTREEGLTPQKVLEMIQDKNVRLKALDEQLRQKNQESITLKMRLETDQELLKELDQDNPTLYGHAFRFQHAEEIEVVGGKSPGFLKSLLGGKGKPAEVRKKRGNGNYVFTNKNAHAPGAVVDLECHSEGGGFTSRTLQGTTFSQTFQYPLGASVFAEVRMKLAKRDVPENKLRIDQAKARISQNTTRLSEIDLEAASLREQQEVLQTEINHLQHQGIDAATLMESLKTQIQQREEWTAAKEKSIATMQAEILECKNSIGDLKLELSVNEDMFNVMTQIIETLGLHQESDELLIKEFYEKCLEHAKQEINHECIVENTVSRAVIFKV